MDESFLNAVYRITQLSKTKIIALKQLIKLRLKNLGKYDHDQDVHTRLDYLAVGIKTPRIPGLAGRGVRMRGGAGSSGVTRAKPGKVGAGKGKGKTKTGIDPQSTKSMEELRRLQRTGKINKAGRARLEELENILDTAIRNERFLETKIVDGKEVIDESKRAAGEKKWQDVNRKADEREAAARLTAARERASKLEGSLRNPEISKPLPAVKPKISTFERLVKERLDAVLARNPGARLRNGKKPFTPEQEIRFAIRQERLIRKAIKAEIKAQPPGDTNLARPPAWHETPSIAPTGYGQRISRSTSQKTIESIVQTRLAASKEKFFKSNARKKDKEAVDAAWKIQEKKDLRKFRKEEEDRANKADAAREKTAQARDKIEGSEDYDFERGGKGKKYIANTETAKPGQKKRTPLGNKGDLDTEASPYDTIEKRAKAVEKLTKALESKKAAHDKLNPEAKADAVAKRTSRIKRAIANVQSAQNITDLAMQTGGERLLVSALGKYIVGTKAINQLVKQHDVFMTAAIKKETIRLFGTSRPTDKQREDLSASRSTERTARQTAAETVARNATLETRRMWAADNRKTDSPRGKQTQKDDDNFLKEMTKRLTPDTIKSMSRETVQKQLDLIRRAQAILDEDRYVPIEGKKDPMQSVRNQIARREINITRDIQRRNNGQPRSAIGRNAKLRVGAQGQSSKITNNTQLDAIIVANGKRLAKKFDDWTDIETRFREQEDLVAKGSKFALSPKNFSELQERFVAKRTELLNSPEIKLDNAIERFRAGKATKQDIKDIESNI